MSDNCCSQCDESLDNVDLIDCSFCGETGCEACIFDVEQESTGEYKQCCQGRKCDKKAMEWTEK